MRILFFGTSAFAVPSLERLVATGFRPLVCMTTSDRPQGRGLKPLPSPIKRVALQHGLLVEEPDDLRAVAAASQAALPDVGVVIAYGRLLPADVLGCARYGMLGVHPSLLPAYRGANPIAWPLLEGARATGVTIFRLNERMDAGDIALQESVAIAPRDTADTLSARLAQRGADLLVKALRLLEQGTLAFHPQEERGATCSEKFTKAHGRIDWHAEAVAIDRLVRAVTPWPGAYTTWQQAVLKIWDAEPAHETDASGRPGEVVQASAAGMVVATGKGCLVIRELQLAGKRRMTAAEFLAGHRLHKGDLFGNA